MLMSSSDESLDYCAQMDGYSAKSCVWFLVLGLPYKNKANFFYETSLFFMCAECFLV